jgi:Sigma 54 modulation/S30EA ribosomal protein C terminus
MSAPNVKRRALIRAHTKLTSPAHAAVAIDELTDLGLEFGLFTEKASHQDSVVWQEPRGGFHLAQLTPCPEELRPCGPDVEIDPVPAPTMTDAEAIIRLDRTDAAFVFFRDRATGRGKVLYRRAHGGYGLIGP